MAYVSYEFFEKRFLRLKRLFGRAEKQGPQSPREVNVAEPYGLPQAQTIREEGWSSKRSGPALPVQVTCNPQLSRARWNRLDSKTSPRRIAREAYFISISLNAMAQIALRKHLPSAANDAFAR